MTPISFVVFPFLKTAGPVTLGGITFRSTDDTTSLSRAQQDQLREISAMLFLKDDLRVRTASYATVPYIDLTARYNDLAPLVRIHSVVAYAYASPHEIFGNLFLSPEQCSVVILSPGPVSILLVRPDHHTVPAEPSGTLTPDQHHAVPGFVALYNFRHHFWAAKGSRIYGPAPNLALNISQNLEELNLGLGARTDLRLLERAISRPLTATVDRVLTAIRWFNKANEEAHDDETAVVCLAIAFETLLALPEKEGKTERIADGIALLLGRIPRLDNWARQFYQARSEIVHEGRAKNLRFVAGDSRPTSRGHPYQSLLSYGRQVFQLCVGSVLAGAEMSERAGLEDRLIANQERFERICELLSDSSVPAAEMFLRIAPIVELVDRYQFVSEPGLKIETMLGAVRLAAAALLRGESALDTGMKSSFEKLAIAKRTADHFEQLTALQEFHDWSSTHHISAARGSGLPDAQTTVQRLSDTVWDHVFMHYYWVKERREAEGGTASAPTPPQ